MTELKNEKSKEEPYLFRFNTKEGYTFKIFADLLKNKVKKCKFTLHPKGIFVKIFDSKGYAIQAKIPGKRFAKYFCPEQIDIGLNTSHFQKMLKPVKKKDSLISSILKSKPDKLQLIPKRPEITSVLDNSVKIITVQSEIINLPKEYDPNLEITCTSKNFQSVIKNIAGVSGKKLIISGYNKQLRFYCDNNDLMHSDNILEDIENEEKYFPDDIKKLDFYATFNPSDITCLNKSVSLSTEIRIARGKDMPLRIILEASKLIELTVHIKSEELLDKEENEKNKSMNDGENDENIVLVDDDTIIEEEKEEESD